MVEREKWDELTVKYQAMVYKIAHVLYKKVSVAGTSIIEFDDLVSNGWLGFTKALQSYDANNKQNASFYTFSYRCVNTAMVDYIRKERRILSGTGAYSTILDSLDEYSERTNLTDILAGDLVDMVDEMAKSDIVQLIYKVAEETLSEKEKFVFKNRFSIEGEKQMTQLQVATLFNMTQAGVSKLEQSIARKIRNVLIMDYGITEDSF